MTNPDGDIFDSTLRVLIVEDEYFIANDLAEMLDEESLIVVGPAADEANALNLLQTPGADCALLDINLSGRPSFKFAATLKERKIPFLFLTGYDAKSVPNAFSDVPLLTKPFERAHVMQSLITLLNRNDPMARDEIDQAPQHSDQSIPEALPRRSGR